MPIPKRPEPQVTTLSQVQKELDRFAIIVAGLLLFIVIACTWLVISAKASERRIEMAEVYCLDQGYTSAVVYDEEFFCLRTVNGTQQVKRGNERIFQNGNNFNRR